MLHTFFYDHPRFHLNIFLFVAYCQHNFLEMFHYYAHKFVAFYSNLEGTDTEIIYTES